MLSFIRQKLTGRLLGVLSILGATMIWGTSYVVTGAALHQAGPFTVTALRFVIGTLTLLPFAKPQGFHFELTTRPTFLLFGLTGIALFFGLQNLGLTFTSASNTALIQAAIPAATGLLSVIFLKERMPVIRILGILLSVSGVAWISLSSHTNFGGRATIGNLFVLLSVIAYGIYTLQGRRLRLHHFAASVTTTASFITGLFFLAPAAMIEISIFGLPKLNLVGWLEILYLGVVCSALTLYLWNYALRHVEASAAALYSNLTPVVGLIAASMVGEHIGFTQIAGGLLAMVGVGIGAVSSKNQRNSAQKKVHSVAQ